MYKNKELSFSLAFGLIFGIITYIIVKYLLPEDAMMLSCFAFIFSFISLFIYLIIHNKRMKKRYDEIEKLINVPIFYKTNGNIRVSNKVFNSNIYFTDGGIVFASFDEKPYRLQVLSLGDILKYEADAVHLNIYTKDNQVFLIALADAQNVINVLKEKGWIQQ